MAKQIQFGDEARQKMFDGMETVAKTVTVTMGPKGRNVVIDKGYGAPQVTNDGVTIAKEIELEDKFENLGAELVKEAADKTNTLAGDGTTTATLLTYAIAKEGLRNIRTGVNAVELKNGMKKAGEKLCEELTKNAKKISSKEEIAQVATISAQDSEVGQIIAEAMNKVGNDGVISVEEGQTFGLDIEITKGMEFSEGYLSPYMVTNTDKMLAEMKNTPILLTDKKISNMKDLLPLLEQLINEGKKDLIIIADDIDGEALTTIILNKLKGVLNILGIKVPGFGDNKKEMLKDIAILTGANIIQDELNMKLKDVTIESLGNAKTVISSKDKTTIIGGEGNKEDINSRIAEIKKAIANSDSSYDKEKLQERLAKLSGGVAVIKVGAASEVEMKEKKMRIEDALNATRAAVEEGVVAGGGVALLKASKVLTGIDLGNEDQNIGAGIIKSALKYPIKQIVENAGKEGSVVINKIEESSETNFGYDAAKDTFVDMIKEGIIDPKKVERVALEESISLAGMFLTTESVITDIPKKSDDTPAMPPMGGMGGMGGMPMM
ncbi:chaperonin GroEL [Candidatus Gracilibacteria bacterium]|nr:MAG: chaperonin GroEL [Candidatus Gracilibacteria bacterium]PIE85309.1 MAG: chaperonin GroEL [Candidatus Gracilibacteria bacterium]